MAVGRSLYGRQQIPQPAFGGGKIFFSAEKNNMLCARMPHVEWREALYYDISSDFSILCNRMQSFALFVSHILHSLYTLLR